MESELTSPTLSLPLEGVPNSVSVCRPLRTILCLVSSDILAVTLALLLASTLRDSLLSNPARPISSAISPALLITLATFTVSGLYPGVGMNPVEELRRSFLSVTLSFLSLWSATFFLHDLNQSRLVYGLAFLFANALVPVCRTCVRAAFCRNSWWGSQVAILGFGDSGKLLLDTLLKNPQIGLKPYAVLDDDPACYAHLEPALIRGPLSCCPEIARDHKISYGIVCMPTLARQELLALLDLYGQYFSHLLVIPNLIGITSLGTCAREVGGIVGLEVTRQLLRPSARLAKRTLDLAITLALAPLIAVLIGVFAIVIRLEEPGPVFYANERIGRRGRKFKAWKLRSMRVDGDAILDCYLAQNPEEMAHWQATQKLRRDPRITRVGRIIRKASIDELPQFWNVLIGQMSVVGPRPVLESQLAIYGPSLHLYQQVRPGITGLWQVSGRNELSFSERVKLDKYVIQNWSVWLDLYILARTPGAILTGDGAY